METIQINNTEEQKFIYVIEKPYNPLLWAEIKKSNEENRF